MSSVPQIDKRSSIQANRKAISDFRLLNHEPSILKLDEQRSDVSILAGALFNVNAKFSIVITVSSIVYFPYAERDHYG